MVKKTFEKVDLNIETSTFIDDSLNRPCPPLNTKISFDTNANRHGSRKSFDFKRFYQIGINEIVCACQEQVELMLLNNSVRPTTVKGACEGIAVFFKFCQIRQSILNRDLKLEDINKNFINDFIFFVSQNYKSNTPYAHAKSILLRLALRNKLDINIFPKNPFPGHNKRRINGEKPFTKPELKKIKIALKHELNRILNPKTCYLTSNDLGVCLLTIALRTGRNLQPLLDLKTDCLIDNPLKPNGKILVTFKNRGNRTLLTDLAFSKKVESTTKANDDVVFIIDKIIELTKSIRQNHEILFIFKNQSNDYGIVAPLARNHVDNAVKFLRKNHDLNNPDGNPIRINVSRFRKTFINKVYELTNGDPILTARLAGHTAKVSSDHYLEPNSDMLKDWKMMGEIRVEELISSTKQQPAIERTPISGCKDTINGRFAPRNGSPCTNFLNCFRCDSFVVTEDDLYRLFSFYWLLIKERQTLGAKKWGRYYTHIIRIIDKLIAPKFNPENVELARSKAQTTPHPFWKGYTITNGEFHV